VSVMHQRCQNIGVSDENTGVSDESTDVIQLLIKFKSTLSDTLVSVIKMQHER
jgi:hypothetical protein